MASLTQSATYLRNYVPETLADEGDEEDFDEDFD